MPVPIPSWNAQGVLPPLDMAAPASANRAPYLVLLSDLVLRFSTSPARTAILNGFLAYRAELHSLGLVDGFQWVNGSFMESIETGPRNRPPNDVDVVTFCRLPAGTSQLSLVTARPDLFPATEADHDALKARLRVDAYVQDLGTASERLVSRTSYWYSLWAHQRDTFQWKGFLQVGLSPAEDLTAAKLLLNPAIGGTP